MHDLERFLVTARPLLDRYGSQAALVAVMVEGIGIPASGQTPLMGGAMATAKKESGVSRA